jgi:hypothetical protein
MKVWKPPVSSCTRAQLQQVVDAVFVVLNVAVEHRRVGLEAQLVRQPRRVQPLFAVDLVVADDGRTRAAKISAPPPGIESTPASRILISVSRW